MKKLTILLLTTIILTSCTKDSTTETPADTLPPATTSGANTAGCYINGKLLIPKNGSQAIGGSPLYGLTTGIGINFFAPIIGDDYRYIWIQNYKDADGYDIYIHFNDMTQGLGDYNIGQSNGQKFSYASNNPQIILETHYNVTPSKVFFSSPNSGIITVTRFDYSSGIYSGIFNCTLYNVNNPSETIQVTSGRFDINVSNLNH